MPDFPDNLLGRFFEGWHLVHKLGEGNSAVVFLGKKGPDTGAVKIFKPSLLQRLPDKESIERIQRELTLMKIEHPSLARVLEGGPGKTHHPYVVLEYIEGFTLDQVRTHLPVERIAPILAQIASAARHLETHGVVHRDIKPANIKVDAAFHKATLLDYGVIRPISDLQTDLTDAASYVGDFVGTLRYSPPEFRARREDHSPEGWRAVTFYQLGAVAYELITGKQLFHDVRPPDMIEAVDRIDPDLLAGNILPGVPSTLVELAKKCLRKDSNERLANVRWEDFECRRFVRQPVVVLVYTGGTIGATVDLDGTNTARLRVVRTENDPFLINFRRRLIRDHGQFAGPDARLPFDLEWEFLPPDKQLLSENASYQTWNDLGALIKKICEKYAPAGASADDQAAHYLAGIVVLHGTDTLAYSASALSLSLRNLPCPVVLTGSNQPPNEKNIHERDPIGSKSDVWKNALLSLQFIQTFGHRFTEVFVCFNDTVHMAINIRKSMIDRNPQPLQWERRVLQEPFFYRNHAPLRQYAYRVIDGLYCNNFYPISDELNYGRLTGDRKSGMGHVRQSAWPADEPVKRSPFVSGVRLLTASPIALLPVDLGDCKVVLLEGFDSGTFPTVKGHPFHDLLVDLVRRAIPIVLITRDGLVPSPHSYAMSLRLPMLRIFGLIAETAAPLLSLVLGEILDAEWDMKPPAVPDRLHHRLGLLEQRIRDYQEPARSGVFKDLVGDVINPEAQRTMRSKEADDRTKAHVQRVTELFAESKDSVKLRWQKRRPFDDARTVFLRQHFLWLLSELVHTFGTSQSGPDALTFWNEYGFAWGSRVRDTVWKDSPSRTAFAEQEADERAASIKRVIGQTRIIRRFLYDNGVADLSATLEVKPASATIPARLSLDVIGHKHGKGGGHDELYAAIGYRPKEAELFRMLRDGAALTLKTDDCRAALDKHYRGLFEHALDLKVSPLDWFLIGTYKALTCSLLKDLRFDPWVDRCDQNKQAETEALRQSIETDLRTADAKSLHFKMNYVARDVYDFD